MEVIGEVVLGAEEDDASFGDCVIFALLMLVAVFGRVTLHTHDGQVTNALVRIGGA